jgi:sugar lactone lactonase YvrE
VELIARERRCCNGRMRAEQFTDVITHHGEGPVWWPDGYLRCVDMDAGDVVDIDADGSETGRTNVGRIAAVVRPRISGGTLVAAERCLVLFDPSGNRSDLPDVFDDPSIRFNEGGCDPTGAFYCGTMAYDKETGRGRFFNFGLDGNPRVVLDSVTISNGFWFTPDGTRAYYIDTPTGRVDVFDWTPDAGLHNRRPFVRIDEQDGHPDGLTVDGDGAVWVACWGGGAVRRFTADGRLDEVVKIPARQVSSCTIGGDRLDRLFITTSRQGLPPDQVEPEAGALFVVDGVPTGQPVLPTRL